MLDHSVVRWEDISRDAKPLFDVWTDGRELDWAKKSWEALCKHRLTSYTNEIERARVMIRLLALAAIYRDFCEIAFDEAHEPEHVIWAGEVDLNRFRLAQCVGVGFHSDNKEEEKELVESALLNLMEKARAEIRDALLKEFDGDSLLFVSLWNTVDFRREEDLEPFENDDSDETESDLEAATVTDKSDGNQQPVEIDWFENADSILNDVTGEKVAAFEWIDQGMPSVH
jgi:hypothetical protein